MTGRKTHILSCLLSFVLGVGVGGYRIAQEFTRKSPLELEQQISTDNGGMLLPEKTVGNGVKLMSAKLRRQIMRKTVSLRKRKRRIR